MKSQPRHQRNIAQQCDLTLPLANSQTLMKSTICTYSLISTILRPCAEAEAKAKVSVTYIILSSRELGNSSSMNEQCKLYSVVVG